MRPSVRGRWVRGWRGGQAGLGRWHGRHSHLGTVPTLWRSLCPPIFPSLPLPQTRGHTLHMKVKLHVDIKVTVFAVSQLCPHTVVLPSLLLLLLLHVSNGLLCMGGPARSYFPAHSEHAQAVSPRDWCEDSRLVSPRLRPNHHCGNNNLFSCGFFFFIFQIIYKCTMQVPCSQLPSII